jgi:hypothetical protein
MKRKHYTNKNATNRNPAVAFYFTAERSTRNQATSAICNLIFFMAFFSS